MRGAETSDRAMAEGYREQSRARALRIGFVAALPSAAAVSFIIWIDTRTGLSETAATLDMLRYWCVASPLIFAASYLLFPAKTRLNHLLLYLFVTSFLFVVSARMGFNAGTPHYERMVYAAGLMAFIAFAALPGGIGAILPAYLAAVALMALSHLAAGTLPAHWRSMTDPVVVMAACSLISYLQEKDRFRGFCTSVTVERQNGIIKKESEKLEAVTRNLMTDMVLARQIQYALIPVRPPRVDGMRIAGMYLPVDAIGGDYYDYITFGGGSKVGLFICDVSGHGIPAALITCMVKTLVSTAGDLTRSPAELLRHINRSLISQVKGNFLTAFYGIYDAASGEFVYARGGHSFPFHVHEGTVSPLKGRGTMLGLDADADFEECSVRLLPGDRLFLYSDGLIEAANGKGVMFEQKLVEEVLPSLSGLPAEVMVNTLFSRLVQFCGNADFEDDICVIGVEVTRGGAA